MPGDANIPPAVNPYLSPTPLERAPNDPAAAPLVSTGAENKARIWTVFAAYGAAFVGTIGFSIVAAVALVAWFFAAGGSPDAVAEFPKFATQPGIFITVAALGQLIILLCSIVPASLSSQPWRQRLGLSNPRIPLWHWPVLVGGATLPFAFGMFCAIAVSWVIPPDPSVALLYEQMTPAMAIPFIFFIAIAPGFSEELLFRGYMQRRLLARWSPSVAILVTSLLFAILHLVPHPVALAFPVGIWLGIVAWRTESTWPCILSHAACNGVWNVYVIGTRLKVLPDPLPIWCQIGFFSIGAICFVASIKLLAQMRPATCDPENPT